MQTILSIAVVTMNRATQLKEALESCLACVLPKETEFVVIDNASTDNTEHVVKETLGKYGYPFYYQKTEVNIGAGGGRNLYFEQANGIYVYGMDDDAVIDFENYPEFFIKAIQIMNTNPIIATLATQIYDKAWGCNRQTISGGEIVPGIYRCRMFCGGSHFLRKSFFKKAPYLPNQYGYEELPPSLIAYDAGMINAFCPNMIAIHQPAIDKWDYRDKKNFIQIVNECAVPYAIKKMMYPTVYIPLLWLAFEVRCKKYLPERPDSKHLVKTVVKDTMSKYKIEYRIKLMTVIKMYFDFGSAIF